MAELLKINLGGNTVDMLLFAYNGKQCLVRVDSIHHVHPRETVGSYIHFPDKTLCYADETSDELVALLVTLRVPNEELKL